MHHDRLFLMTLALMPACGGDDSTPPAPGETDMGSTTGGSTGTTGESTSTGEERPSTDASTSTSGQGSSEEQGNEGSSTSAGSADPVDDYVQECVEYFQDCADGATVRPATLESYCTEYANELDALGPNCLSRAEEVLACINASECRAFDNGDCNDVMLAAATDCPDAFSPCLEFESTLGDSCSYQYETCVGGDSYSIECEYDESTDTLTCACNTSGVRETETLSGPCPDEAALLRACGFPASLY